MQMQIQMQWRCQTAIYHLGMGIWGRPFGSGSRHMAQLRPKPIPDAWNDPNLPQLATRLIANLLCVQFRYWA